MIFGAGTSAIRAFLGWWTGELCGLIPRPLRERRGRRDRLVLLFGDRVVAISQEMGRATKEVARLDRGTEDAAALAATLRRNGLSRAAARGGLEVVLRLPAEQALRTRLALPLEARENLRGVVAFELDRHTPFAAEQVNFACRLLPESSMEDRVAVEVTAAPRPAVAAALAWAQDAGLVPDRVDVAASAPDGEPSENLLAEDADQGPRDFLTFGLAGAVVLLAIVALAIPVVRAHYHATELRHEMAVAGKALQQAQTLRGQISALKEEENFLVERKREKPTVSHVLLNATRVIPDDAWVEEFQLNASEAQFTGLAASASALVSLIEQSGHFSGTTFRSPVMFDPRAERERFSIAARLVAGAAK
jgi:general secretion pathway protein L